MPMTLQQAQMMLRQNPALARGMPPDQAVMMLMAQEAPTAVTPASPAPVAPGANIEAPVAADYRNQEALAANMTPAQDMIARARAAAQERIAQTEATAAVPAEIEGLLRAREERTDRELGESETERKQAMWLAVAMAGAKMASSESPYFMSALAEGLDAGLQGFSKAKAEAAERRARLMDKKEQTVLDRYNALQQQKQMALQKLDSGERMTKSEMDLINATEKEMHEKALRPLELRAAEEELKMMPLKRDLVKAQIGSERAQAAASYARAARGDGGGGGDGSDGKIPYQESQQYNAEMDRATKILAMAQTLTDPKEKKAYVEAANAIARAAAQRMNAMTQRVYGGSAPRAAAPAAPASAQNATMRYLPGKGLVPVK